MTVLIKTVQKLLVNGVINVKIDTKICVLKAVIIGKAFQNEV